MAIAINVLKLLFAKVVAYISPSLMRFYWFPRIINCALYFIKRLYLSNL